MAEPIAIRQIRIRRVKASGSSLHAIIQRTLPCPLYPEAMNLMQ